MGKHVYCQKPLTHDVYEARILRQLAKEHGVATQMGNQGSASDGLRRAVEVVHAGLIGHVRQAYVWTNRPIWPQGLDRPPGSDSVPEGLDGIFGSAPPPSDLTKQRGPEEAVADAATACTLPLPGGVGLILAQVPSATWLVILSIGLSAP